MNRRGMLIALAAGSFATPYGSFAQQKIWRVAYFGAGSKDGPNEAAFLGGMRALGYEVGRNLLLEARFADGNPARWPTIADELIALKPDVLVVSSTGNTLVVKGKTNTIPVVMGSVGDPVGDGIVQSLGKPGGNITGNSLQFVELGGKQIEFMVQALPHIRRAVLLVDLSQPSAQVDRFRQISGAAASKNGLALDVRGVNSADELRGLLRSPQLREWGALLLAAAPRFNTLRGEICRAAAGSKLPLIGFAAEWPQDGALMSYSPSWAEAYRRAAYFVDRILKGAKPAELPVEQPTKFELVINRKTAKALGIVLPPSILARADRVIE